MNKGRCLRSAVVGILLATSVGCKTERDLLGSFDDLEQGASRFGLIAVGAVRAADYTNGVLREVRTNQIVAIHNLETNLAGLDELKKTIKPEQASASLNVAESAFALAVSYGNATGLTNTQSRQDFLDNLKTAFVNGLTNASAESVANEIDTTRLRLAELKFLAQEEENLRLDEIIPVDHAHFSRVMLSVELTAMVHPERASGVVVYLDLYPGGADVWCHEAGMALSNATNNASFSSGNWHSALTNFNDSFQAEWIPRLRHAAFYEEFSCADSISLLTPPQDPVAIMHGFLEHNQLLPQIVHVEPLDEGELVREMSASGTAKERSASVSGGYKGLTGAISSRHESTKAQSLSAERVNQLSLAFAAGDRRAGWLFLPSAVGAGITAMKPSERRITMIVDVPKHLRLMTINVHKVFLDRKLHPIPDASFARQMADLNRARRDLSQLETPRYFPFDDRNKASRTKAPPTGSVQGEATDFPTESAWVLAKSRLRNSLTQFWSETLNVVLPRSPTK